MLTSASSRASTSRSIPAPNPTPGVGGPPISSTRPSYRPPPESALSAPTGLDELPGGPRVVIEAPYERRHESIAHSNHVESTSNGGEVVPARSAERLPDHRGLAQHLLNRRWLLVEIVEHAEWVRHGLLARRCVQALGVRLEPRPELLEVGRTTVPASDRVELELVPGHPEPVQQRVVELDHLGVERRIVGADRLDGQLPELAVAAALRVA